MDRRRSIRLPEYDYTSPGAYFVTLCIHDRAMLLGEVVEGIVRLSAFGKMAHYEWRKLPQRFTDVSLDVFVIMPNHLHGIIWILDGDGDTVGARLVAGRGLHRSQRRAPTGDGDDLAGSQRRAPTDGQTEEFIERFGQPVPGSIPTIVRAFKSATTRRDNSSHNTPGAVFWQRNYWECVIRSESELGRIEQYIQDNPGRWSEDQLCPC